MKRRVIAYVILITGVCLLFYPVVGNIINVIRQSSVQTEYNDYVNEMNEEEKVRLKEEAENYNKQLANGEIEFSAVGEEDINSDLDDPTGYNKALYVGSEVFAFIKIPKINIELPIYKGTAELTLEKGIGHLRNTSLPIGGESTHCVLTGHTGMPSSMLFTDIDKLETGDLFYIKYLDEILAYRVNQIKIVEPNDTSDLNIENGKDYVTLLTCYPYGINSHRLLVRGERVPFSDDIVFGDEKVSTDIAIYTDDKGNIVSATADNAEYNEELTKRIVSDLNSNGKYVSVYGMFVPFWLIVMITSFVAVLVLIPILVVIVRKFKKRNKSKK